MTEVRWILSKDGNIAVPVIPVVNTAGENYEKRTKSAFKLGAIHIMNGLSNAAHPNRD